MKTETREAFYLRKIEECEKELNAAAKGGKQTIAKYYKRELANYKQCLKNYLNS